MEDINPKLTVKKIKFNDDTEMCFNEDDIIIFVGANNVGKSRSLKDIKDDLLESQKSGVIIKEIEYLEKNFDKDKMTKYFEKNFVKDQNSFYNLQFDHNHNYSFGEYNFDCDYGSIDSKIFYKALFTLLSTENRLNLTLPVYLNSIDDKVKLNMIERLKDSEQKISRINHYLANNFKKGIEIDDEYVDGSYSILYKIGEVDEIESIMRSNRRTAHEKLKEMESLGEQGDGIRSAVAILASLIVNDYSLFLIDEPEAFLHPPQARTLGNNIVELSENKQCFLSTHNIDLIRGILEKNSSRVRIIKINRNGNKNEMHEVINEDVQKVTNDRNLKYTNILNGLFYSKVVLCEDETDCKFYSAILENLDEKMYQNTLFCAVGGKDQFKIITPLLRSMKIEYEIIADIDLINDSEKLKQLINSIEKNKYSEIKEIHQSFLSKYGEGHGSLGKKQCIIKQEINDLFTDDEYMATTTKMKIKKVLKEANVLELLKTGGISTIPQGQCSKDYKTIKKFLKENSVHILDCGEIERFVPEIDAHGNAWVEEVFKRYSNINDTIYDGAKEFIKDVFGIN